MQDLENKRIEISESRHKKLKNVSENCGGIPLGTVLLLMAHREAANILKEGPLKDTDIGKQFLGGLTKLSETPRPICSQPLSEHLKDPTSSINKLFEEVNEHRKRTNCVKVSRRELFDALLKDVNTQDWTCRLKAA